MGLGMGIGNTTPSPTPIPTLALPLALPLAQVALRLLREGEGHTLAHCLRAEFRAAQRFMQHGTGPQGHARSDFFEGIRAALVDKDKVRARATVRVRVRVGVRVRVRGREDPRSWTRTRRRARPQPHPHPKALPWTLLPTRVPDPQPLSLSPSLALSPTRILPSFRHQAVSSKYLPPSFTRRRAGPPRRSST